MKTENSNSSNSWKLNSSGSWNGNNNRNNNNGVRGLLSVLSDGSEPTFEELYEAYVECRRRKRGTREAIEFEIDENHNLLRLYEELIDKTYEISPSYVFVVMKPKPREVFAARYRDRIVHHLLCRRLEEKIEKDLIDTTYSCRKGKGTLKCLKDSLKCLTEYTEGFKMDAYVFKGDIEGFFMNIDKNILFSLLKPYIEDKYTLWLSEKILFNDPTENCIRRSSDERMKLIPDNKSLFSRKGKGLPIGNLPSQMFANLYMNEFGRFVISKGLPIFIYVDDFAIFSHDKDYLKAIIRQCEAFLKQRLELVLHSKKRYLQHCYNGYRMVGGIIKPFRLYISNNIKESLYKSLDINSKVISYLGLMGHFNTYNVKLTIYHILLII